MPKKVKQVNQSEQINQVEPTDQPTSQPATSLIISKEDYVAARATIKSYRENKKNQPKRKCSEAQLAALAAGRAKNKPFANKSTGQNQ